MTEIVVESVISETVIDIVDGPTLTTQVDEVVETIVSEAPDPIIIDLNSGPRGEPGAAILVGPHPPPTDVGVMGDMYIVTQGSVLVGEVFRKTSGATWTDVGNVRGPAGGVNTVNGYTGPDVILSKSDVGLANVDNTSDLNKPISSATQTALDQTVKLTGDQTISGAKAFSTLTSTAFAIKPSGDHGYISFYSRDAAPGTRTAYVGVGAAGSTTFTIANEMTNGSIQLAPNGTGQVNVSSNLVVAGTISGNGSGITAINGSNVSTGTVADARLSSNISRLNAAETITANKTFSSTSVLSVSDGKLRVGTSTTARNVLMADSSGYASWGNPDMIDSPKNATDDSSTYKVGIYMQETGSTTGWPVGLGTIQTAFLHTNRAFQFAVEKTTSRTFIRSADSGLTASGGWSGWTLLSDDSKVVHLAGSETISGAKTFSSSPIVPTPTAWNHAAHKQYVDDRINATIDAAPGALDTLNELAAALGDDPNFATTVTNSIATKEPIINAGTTAQYWRGDKTWQTLNAASVGLGSVTNDAQVTIATAQTITGQKTFSTDTYFTGKVRATVGTEHNTYTDITLGQVAGDVAITRRHTHAGGTNSWHIIEMVHRRAAGNDWTFTQNYTGIGIDTSYQSSPTTGTAATALKTWMRRDPINSAIGFGSGVSEYLTLTPAAVTVGTGVVFTGNGSGLTTLNGSNISSGTVADARLSTNVALLAGAQTFSGAKTFSSEIIGPATGNVLKVGDDARLVDVNVAHYMGVVSQTDTAQGGIQFGATQASTFRIGADATLLRFGWGGTSNIVTISAAGAITASGFSGAGSQITSINASNIATGTITDARLSTNVALLSATQTFSGTNTFTSALTVNNNMNVRAIELGRTDGVASTPYIDFHAGATSTDYDGRIIMNTGTGTVGAGNMQFVAGSYTFTTGAITGNGSGLNSLNASNLASGTVPQARLVPNVTQVNHGTIAGVVRPTNATYVMWVGTVQPTNALAGDIWWNA